MKMAAPDGFDELMMTEALKQAQLAFGKEEVPVGAVIVHKQKIIARAFNQVEMLKDPTAHCEMIAITQACHFLDSKWLTDCTLYTTLEPCSMCCGALILARAKRLVYAADDPKTGACGSVLNIAQNSRLNHRLEIQKGIFSQECTELLKVFFQKKRLKNDQ